MKKIIFITSIVISLLCSCKQSQTVAIEPTELDLSKLYKVINIEEIKGSDKTSLSVYRIDIQRNDSIFIILSKSFSPKMYIANQKQIQKGKSYTFDLKPLFTKEEISERFNSPLFAINYLDYKHPIYVQGSYIHVDWDCIVNSYTTNNLLGIYYNYKK